MKKKTGTEREQFALKLWFRQKFVWTTWFDPKISCWVGKDPWMFAPFLWFASCSAMKILNPFFVFVFWCRKTLGLTRHSVRHGCRRRHRASWRWIENLVNLPQHDSRHELKALQIPPSHSCNHGINFIREPPIPLSSSKPIVCGTKMVRVIFVKGIKARKRKEVKQKGADLRESSVVSCSDAWRHFLEKKSPPQEVRLKFLEPSETSLEKKSPPARRWRGRKRQTTMSPQTQFSPFTRVK